MIIKSIRRFTILEMLIAFSIILIVGGAIGIGIVKAREQQRFNASVQIVVDKLQLAQDFMLMLKTDVWMKYEINGDGNLICYVKVDRPLSPQLYQVLNLHSKIPGIHTIAFEDEQHHMQIDTVRLEFLSGGSKMSRGVLKITGKGSNIRYILLPGYPQPIQNTFQTNEREIRLPPLLFVDSELFPKEITEDWLKKQKEGKNNEEKKTPDKKNGKSGETTNKGLNETE